MGCRRPRVLPGAVFLRPFRPPRPAPSSRGPGTVRKPFVSRSSVLNAWIAHECEVRRVLCEHRSGPDTGIGARRAPYWPVRKPFVSRSSPRNRQQPPMGRTRSPLADREDHGSGSETRHWNTKSTKPTKKLGDRENQTRVSQQLPVRVDGQFGSGGRECLTIGLRTRRGRCERIPHLPSMRRDDLAVFPDRVNGSQRGTPLLVHRRMRSDSDQTRRDRPTHLTRYRGRRAPHGGGPIGPRDVPFSRMALGFLQPLTSQSVVSALSDFIRCPSRWAAPGIPGNRESRSRGELRTNAAAIDESSRSETLCKNPSAILPFSPSCGRVSAFSKCPQLQRCRPLTCPSSTGMLLSVIVVTIVACNFLG